MLGKTSRSFIRWIVATGLAAALLVVFVPIARAHCDALDGPVVTDARAALTSGKVVRVLKWVRRTDEQAVRDAFARAVKVRALGGEARALADQYFFETLVRLHRAGEGEPFTGLKPAGRDPGPGVKTTDAALAKGKPDKLIEETTEAVARAIRKRFHRANEAKKHADHSIVQGRQFVAAYTELVHYIERVHHAGQFGHARHEEKDSASRARPKLPRKRLASRALSNAR